jgi:hypothetical protein
LSVFYHFSNYLNIFVFFFSAFFAKLNFICFGIVPRKNMMRTKANYQNNHSLLFQFIVTECSAVCELIKNWKKAIQRKDFTSAKEIYTNLMGPNQDQIHAFAIYFHGGLLAKLQRNCEHFDISEETSAQPQGLRKRKETVFDEKQDSADDTPRSSLKIHILKMNEICDQIGKIWKKDPYINLANLSPISQLFEKIERLLKKIGQILDKLFLQFADDESVLLYLLQHQETLDRTFHPHFVRNLLTKMFPKNLNAAKSYLLNQFSQRGYHQLLPKISEALKELQNQD